jgi:hypothetical protein
MLNKMLIVGGHFGIRPQESGIIKKLVKEFPSSIDITFINGGSTQDLKTISFADNEEFDVILWFPHVDNIIEKFYPNKKQGAILIISKRDPESRAEAVSRIFKMHANAVILISKEKPFTFKFVDALNNVWGYETRRIDFIRHIIMNFITWSRESIRESLHQDAILPALIELNKKVADQHEADMGRYFGNLSTRCMKMFPSTRFYFSRRNVDKRRIEPEDMVFVEDTISDTQPIYYGNHKPSIDTPVQLALYEEFPEINYFIHGHAFVPGYPETEDYFPCGDLREVPGIIKLIKETATPRGIINLKNHGFLIYAKTLAELSFLVTAVKFSKKG